MVFFSFSSGEGETFNDPTLLDNLREHHVSSLSETVLQPQHNELSYWLLTSLLAFPIAHILLDSLVRVTLVCETYELRKVNIAIL